MVKRGFTTRIFISYLVIVLLISLSFGIFSAITLKKHYIDIIEEDLWNNAILIRDLLLKDTPALDEEVEKLGLEIGQRITIIDKSGRVLADSEKDPLLMENHALRPEVRMALKDGIGKSIRFSRTIGVAMLYLAIPSGNGVVRLSVPLTEVRTAIYGMTRNFVIFIFLLCFSLLFITFMLSKKIGKPICLIAKTAKEIAGGDLEKRVSISTDDEIGSLAFSFNKMADELKKRIDTVTKERNFFGTVLDGIIEAVFVVDKDGKIIIANPSFRKMFPGSLDRYYYEIIRNEVLGSLLEKALSDGFQQSREVILYLPEERIFYVYTSSIKDKENVIGACIVMRDITEIKKLERMRIDFVANVSHELKTPLTAIQTATETLKKEIPEKGSAGEFIDIIERQSTRLGNLISDLLDLSEIESKERKMKIEDADLNQIIKRVHNNFNKRAEKKQQNFRIILPEKETCVQVDQEKVEQAIANLADNAIKFTQNGGEVTISLTEDKKEVRIEVSDTGPGIPPCDVPRIFERFYRVDKARSRKLGGTGLGLSIVKHIVEAHNGRVEVKTEPDKGSKFTISLPKPATKTQLSPFFISGTLPF